MKLADAIIAIINRAAGRALQQSLAEAASLENRGEAASKPEASAAAAAVAGSSGRVDPFWALLAKQRREENDQYQATIQPPAKPDQPKFDNWAEAIAGDVGNALYQSVSKLKDSFRDAFTSFLRGDSAVSGERREASAVKQTKQDLSRPESLGSKPAVVSRDANDFGLLGQIKKWSQYIIPGTGMPAKQQAIYDAADAAAKPVSINYKSLMANMGNPSAMRDAQEAAAARAMRPPQSKPPGMGRAVVGAFGKIATVGMGLLSFASAIVVGTGVFKRWTDSLAASRSKLAQYNGEIAGSVAMLRAQEVRLGYQSGAATQGTSTKLLDAVRDFREEFQPLSDAVTNLMNTAFTELIKIGTEMLRIATWAYEKFADLPRPEVNNPPMAQAIDQINAEAARQRQQRRRPLPPVN
jgi:hypothetical protein